jgi:NAD(P)H-hydrate epimerase
VPKPPPPSWPARDAAHLLVRGEQMAALEEQLFRSGLPVEALMEKAALAVSRLLLEQEGERLRRAGAVVLVGPGHNGGDGLVVARELHLAGIAVAVWSPFAQHKALTAAHLSHACWLGVPRLEAPPAAHAAALWIDALFGIGQRRPPDPALEALLLEREQRQPGGLVAIDVPTGICADEGHCLGGGAATAVRTYCLGLLKRGLVQDQALRWVGVLERVDLGLPGRLLAGLPADQPLALHAADLAAARWPQPDPAASKYGRGRLLVVAGSLRFRGAAALTLAGASASGCGSLRAALCPAVGDALWPRFPHLVQQATLDCDRSGALKLAQLTPTDLQRLDAVLVGPGLGLGDDAEGGDGEAWTLLQRFHGLLVLDADGLNRLSRRPEGAGAWLGQRLGPTWITPHRQEFGRLFPDLQSLPPLDAAAAAAGRCGAAVLLKGAHSAVAAPDGRRWQLVHTAAAAARAGLGDVLAGYGAGLGALAGEGGGDAQLLALAALAHATAGLELARTGAGAAAPAAVAARLAQLAQLAPGHA